MALARVKKLAGTVASLGPLIALSGGLWMMERLDDGVRDSVGPATMCAGILMAAIGTLVLLGCYFEEGRRSVLNRSRG